MRTGSLAFLESDNKDAHPRSLSTKSRKAETSFNFT